jgi:hypothetical protein
MQQLPFFGHAPQSAGQDWQSSPYSGWQPELPQHAPQSAGQDWQSSSGSHWLLPHTGPHWHEMARV